MTDGTVVSIHYAFKIKATAKGGANVSKDVNVSIIICGYETLSLVDSNIISKTLVVRDNVTDSINIP